jgi:hypothetical protein
MNYAQRCERYASQRGWHYDEHVISIHRLTPRQRRRALKKERHYWYRPYDEAFFATLVDSMTRDPAPCSHCGQTDHDSDHCPGQGG